MHAIATRILVWYEGARRDLPWRALGTSAWGVYVSEVMSQQTQVERVAHEWPLWMERWPTPAALAASTPADVLRAWGSMGYPRRALWMHAAAVQMVQEHGGEVPSDGAALLLLPGVGEYTAAAVRAFAYRQRVPVLDVNVRRVHARLFDGSASAGPSITNAEREHHERFLPSDAETAAVLSQAVMEFGSMICSARDPRCGVCPLADRCSWNRLGRPSPTQAPRRAKRFEGSDRQCRGALMRVLREAHAAVGASALEDAWADALQRARCLDSLVSDGLVVPLAGNRYALPT